MGEQVTYLTFMKHAQKVTKSAHNTRPVLKTVYHSNKHVAVTDSHRLYVITDVYEGEEKTLNPATGIEEEHGRYPEIERLLMPENSIKYSQEIDVNAVYDTVRAIEIANKLTRETTDLIVGINDEEIVVSTSEYAGFSVKLPNERDGEKELYPTLLETKYLREALHVLRDAKVVKATFKYVGKNQPVEMVAGNFNAVIMPKRLPEEIYSGRVITNN